MTDVQTIYIVIVAIKILFDRNQISILLWRKFFLFSIVVVMGVRKAVVEVVVTSVTSVASVVRVSVGVVVKLRISLGFTLGNNMFGSHARDIWVVAVSVWVGISVWVASVSSCWVSSINMWVYSMMSICRVKKSGISLSFALGNNMGDGILVIVVWDDSMVVVDWVVDSMVVDGVGDNQLLFGLFNSFHIFVMLLGDFDGVSLFWNALLGHTFGVMRVDIFDDGHNRIYNRYTPVTIEELGVSFWLSKSDCHKGEQSNKAEHG